MHDGHRRRIDSSAALFDARRAAQARRRHLAGARRRRADHRLERHRVHRAGAGRRADASASSCCCRSSASSPSIAALLAFGALWLVAGACAVLAATFSLDPQRDDDPRRRHALSLRRLVVLPASSPTSPRAHTELIFKAWTVAAAVAAAAAIIGYFGLLPGAYELFTLYDRASGTFKDPNVFGPFLIVPLLYMLSIALEQPAARHDPAARHRRLPHARRVPQLLARRLDQPRRRAGDLRLPGARHDAQRPIVRLKIVGLLAAGSIIAAGVVVAAAQLRPGRRHPRASAPASSSPTTPAPKAASAARRRRSSLILEHPLGIGAQEFTARHHPEEVHNVYLTMLLSAGWLGGGIYLDPRRPDAGARLPPRSDGASRDARCCSSSPTRRSPPRRSRA